MTCGPYCGRAQRSAVLQIGNDLLYPHPMTIGDRWMGVVLRSDDDQRLPQAPAARPSPGVGVKPDTVAKCLTGRLVEQRPGDGEIAGRIAGAAGTEIDDGDPRAASQMEVIRITSISSDRISIASRVSAS